MSRGMVLSLMAVALTISSASAENLCLSLLGPPTEAEKTLSSEGRLALLYSRILTQYRAALTEGEYVKFLENAMKNKSYYSISPTTAAHTEMSTVFEKIRQMRLSEVLPSGEKISGAEIDKLISKNLDEEWKSIYKLREEISSSTSVIPRAPLKVLLDEGNSIGPFELSPDGKTGLIVSSYFVPGSSYPVINYKITVLNTESGKKLHTLIGHHDLIRSVRISPDARRALTASDDRSLILWDLETGEPIHKMHGHSNWISSIQVSPDFKRAISSSGDRDLVLWDLETGAILHRLTEHTDTVLSVQVSSDFTRAVSSSRDGSVIIWDLKTGKKIKKIKNSYDLNSLRVNADCTKAVSIDGSRLIISNLKGNWGSFFSSFAQKRLSGHTLEVTSVKVSKDFKRAITTSVDKTIILWDLESGKLLHRFSGHNRKITSISMSSDFSHAMSASEDGALIAWDLVNYKNLGEFTSPGGGVLSVEVDSGFTHAVSSSVSGKLMYWDLVLLLGPSI